MRILLNTIDFCVSLYVYRVIKENQQLSLKSTFFHAMITENIDLTLFENADFAYEIGFRISQSQMSQNCDRAYIASAICANDGLTYYMYYKNKCSGCFFILILFKIPYTDFLFTKITYIFKKASF